MQLTHGRSASARRIWLYSKADFDAINVHLEEPLHKFKTSFTDSVDSAWEFFHSTFLLVMWKHIPTRRVSGKSTLPWLIPSVKRALERRNRTNREAKKRNLTDMWSRFRLLRNRAVSVIHQAKKYFFDQLTLNKEIRRLFGRVIMR